MTMNEKQGAAKWLRGIIDGYEADGDIGCSDMAKRFGNECSRMGSCRNCMIRMVTTIADRIDREMMELPKDAEGEPIRIGDVLYSSGNECRVVSITVKADEACVGVHTDEGAFLPSVNPKYLSRKKPEPADSWEKLEEDMMRGTSCLYFRGVESALKCCDCPHGIEQTGTLCWKNERIDILKRAKKLAKAGEVE